MPQFDRGRADSKTRSAKQVSRRRHRQAQARVAEAMQNVHQHQQAVDEMVHEERPGAVPGAAFRRQPKVEEIAPPPPAPRSRPGRDPLTWEGEGHPGWTMAQARSMIRQGYVVTIVIKRTGVGYRWLHDLCGDDGYYTGEG